MERYTQQQLRALVKSGAAQDITHADNAKREEIEKEEGYLSQVGYSAGVYGCNGMLFVGHATKKLYAITSRTQAIYIFG